MAKLLVFTGISRDVTYGDADTLLARLARKGVNPTDVIFVDYQSAIEPAAQDVLDLDSGPGDRASRARAALLEHDAVEVLEEHIRRLREVARQASNLDLEAKTFRELFIRVLGDALFWLGGATRPLVTDAVLKTLEPLQGEPKAALCHSLGTVVLPGVMYEIARGDHGRDHHQGLRLMGADMCGSPLRLFARCLYTEPWKHFQFKPWPPLGIDNWVDPKDPVAWPLHKWFQRIIDHEIANSVFLGRFRPLTAIPYHHTGYFEREDVIQAAAWKYLKACEL